MRWATRSWSRRSTAAAAPPTGIAEHVYGVEWADARLGAEPAAPGEGVWVILDDGTGVAAELAARLRATATPALL